MLYLLDTVTVFRHFTDSGTIGERAREVLEHIELNEDSAVISIISLMEIMYLSEKNRIDITLSETLQKIDQASNCFAVDLTPLILQTAEQIDFHELHDRLILATAKYLDIPILSSDQGFNNVEEINSIWD